MERSLLQACTAVGQRMHELRTEEAPHALLLAGRFAAEQGSESAHDLLNAAARYRRNPSALVRATGWLAQAVDREASGNSRGVFAACSRGLDALDEHRMTLGSSELRALATGHGEELANLALREAVLTGDARRLLTWSERWRATALTQPPVRPPREARLASQLAALRSQSLHLDEVRAGQPGRRRWRLWRKSIRSQQHQLPGVAGPTAPVRHAAVHGRAGRRRVRRAARGRRTPPRDHGEPRSDPEPLVGDVSDALAAVAAARFVLRQAARGRPATLTGVGERLQGALLGPAADSLGGGPVVVAPPSRLHATPWALLPALSHRPVERRTVCCDRGGAHGR